MPHWIIRHTRGMYIEIIPTSAEARRSDPNMADELRRALAILRLRQVKERTGRSRSSIYADVKAGLFPEPINIGPRAVGWIEGEIDDWLAEKINSSRTRAT